MMIMEIGEPVGTVQPSGKKDIETERFIDIKNGIVKDIGLGNGEKQINKHLKEGERRQKINTAKSKCHPCAEIRKEFDGPCLGGARVDAGREGNDGRGSPAEAESPIKNNGAAPPTVEGPEGRIVP